MTESDHPATMTMDAPSGQTRAGDRVLVLGAYGLIGYGITRRLLAAGYRVTGLGRNAATAGRVLPELDWVLNDIRTLTAAADWAPILRGISAVVNCAGALQDGPGDDLEAVHHHAIAALATACAASGTRLIQISAVGAEPDASTRFMASKARGDAAIRASGCRYHIFRPGLVLAPHAYGGTALLRMLAAVPLVQPIAIPDARIQTVSLDDIAFAVCAALDGKVPDGFVGDLVERDTHSLREIVTAVRTWLGFGEPKLEVRAGKVGTAVASAVADAVSDLGWRSPMRTTALATLTEGVTGNPSAWDGLGLRPLSPLRDTLASMPATAEDRLFARMSLLLPLLIATLFAFWLLSGLIGLARIGQAAEVLQGAGWPRPAALASVAVWSAVDIAIAAALLIRRTAKAACWAMVIVSCAYLVASTVIVPHLWLDPLGPLIKIGPGIVLALVTRVALETR